MRRDAGQILVVGFAILKGFSFGVLALRRASPAFAALVRSSVERYGVYGNRYRRSFLQRNAASVAQRFFMGRARLQGWAPPFGLQI